MTKRFFSRKVVSLFVMVFMAFLLVACAPGETPIETPIETPVETPSETPVETPVETPTETPEVQTRIYFYNSADWENVSAYTFNPEFFGGWPGVLATQDGDSDWFYVDVPQDPTVTAINIIFNNGGAGSQTADILIDSLTDVYITVRNEVFGSKEAAEASFEEPVVTTRVYFLNSNGWSEVNAYTYSPELLGGWPGTPAMRDGESDWYYIDVPQDTSVTAINIIFNGGGSQTDDIVISNNTDVYVTVNNGVFASKALAEDSLPKDIVQTAIAAGSFETLVAAIIEAELDGAPAGEGPFTVFAPNDAAFTALLTDLGITAEQLLADPGLADILLFNVVAGQFLASDVITAAPFYVETLNGDFVYIEVVDGNVLVNGSTVILPNVLASNGIIHVIDAVILPQTLLYSTGFESEEGFTASTTYNNTSEVLRGPVDGEFAFYYGTPSTTSPLSGSQSAQMRWYTSAPANLGYTYMNFDVADVSKVVFSAAGTNGVNVIVSVSSDGGTTFVNEQTFVLTSTSADFVYEVAEALQTGNLRVKFQITFEVAPTATSRLYIDDLRLFG